VVRDLRQRIKLSYLPSPKKRPEKPRLANDRIRLFTAAQTPSLHPSRFIVGFSKSHAP
jgi:hypothetical protein